MSIQLVVCTPWYYFEDRQISEDFVELVENKVGFKIDNADNVASCSFDLPISAFSEIDDLIYNEYGDCIERDIFLTGLILPFKFDGMHEIAIPEKDTICIVSYETFSRVLDKYESLVRNKTKSSDKLDNYMYFINTYRSAIRESLKNKQIIIFEP